MNRKERKPLAAPVAEMQRELEEYRRSRPRRAKLPESIWEAAAALARERGVYAVAQALRLDYMGLKKRLGDVPSQRPANSKPVFVELIAPPPTQPEKCLIEFESTRGDKMRIHWPASDRVTARLARYGTVIQITAQMRVLVAVEPVDGRKGIDGLTPILFT